MTKGWMKTILKKITRGPKKYINGTKGVISLFLAILMLPFTTIAGSLVNAARIDSAVAIFDEALSNASNSTLGTYDSFLRKRFGLLAMSQNLSNKGNVVNEYTVNQLISETFDYYMEQNLGALSNTYMEYESNAEGVYSLADQDVLLYQILEYSKYSVPTKMIEEGISLDKMIGTLENLIPGKDILKLITAGAGVADSFVTLAEDYDLLKTAVSDGETALGNYKTAYTSFKTAVSSYVDTKQEMQNKLNEQQKIIDDTTNNNKAVFDEIDALENEIVNLKKEQNKGTNNAEAIKEKTEDLETVKENNKDIVKKVEDARGEKKKIETEYTSTLSTLQTNVNDAKNTYSSNISTLSGCLSTVSTKLTKVKTDIANVGSSVGTVATTTVETVANSSINSNNEKINEIKKKMEDADEETKKMYEKQIADLENSNNSTANQKTAIKAFKSGVDSALGSAKSSITDFNVDIYTNVITQLRNLKTTVDNYNTTNIETKINKSVYYVGITGLLTSDIVEKAEADIVGSCVSSSIWAIIQAIIGFFKALFKVSTIYNPELAAVIDSNYYSETYGGLPSEKDRTIHPLKEGTDEDRELSEYYKSLFGDYSATDIDSLGDFDVIATVIAIFTDIGIITVEIGKVTSIVGLFNFASSFKKMMDAAQNIVTNIGKVMDFLKNFLSNVVGPKLLLSGYVSYMTSCRTTYTGTALTGASYNLRGQVSDTVGDVPSIIDDFAALISTFQKVAEGGTDNCFVGAETEYILFGGKSEVGNQAATFAIIYLLRVLADLVPIFTNVEVTSIAAASTIASPLVYLIYILIEPLVDTLILVNGGNVPLIKNTVFLTPSGISSMISAFTTLKLPTDEITKTKDGLLNSLGVNESYENFSNSMKEKVAKNSSYFDVSYSQTLLILMTLFTPRNKMLQRMSNIIQMEAVEYMAHQVGSNKLFDLDYSYTYIRAEASFTTNEFISISDSLDLKSRKRVVYRGY